MTRIVHFDGEEVDLDLVPPGPGNRLIERENNPAHNDDVDFRRSVGRNIVRLHDWMDNHKR